MSKTETTTLVSTKNVTTPNGVSVEKKIKAIVLTSTGSGSDYSNLKLLEENYPTIENDNDVIVRIKAAGLNFAELMQRQGLYRPAQKTPYTPGYEGSGIVERVGAGVTDLNLNDRVIVFNSFNMWKEVVRVPRINLVKMPDNMSFDDGAALLTNYVTAYQILFRMANIKPGDVVLIHMAAGGVGTAATQLCRTVPGVVIIGTASSAKHDAIRENGVTYAIDYTTSDYVEEVKKLYPNGIDVVLDPLNGDNSIKGYQMLRPFGRICHYGAASITTENRSLMTAFKAWWKCLSVNSLDIVSENKSVSGYHLGYLINNPVVSKELFEDLKTLLELYQHDKIRIKVDSTYSYSKIGEAMKRMHARQNVGKILIKPDYEFNFAPVSADQVKIVTTVVTTTTTTAVPEVAVPVVPISQIVESTSQQVPSTSADETAAPEASGAVVEPTSDTAEPKLGGDDDAEENQNLA